jgi:hypothetical protein
MLLHLPVAFTALLSLATAVVANPFNVERLHGIETRDTGRKCGSHPPPETVSKQEKAFNSLLAENEATVRVTDATAIYTIPVNFHVIYANRSISRGYVP